MPTTVTSSIGTAGGRDYSTLQSWEDAAPADLVTADEIWRGEAYNDSEYLETGAAVLLTVSGSTTDATRYKELTAATGESFKDDGSVRSNPLTYDQAVGVGLRNTSSYGEPLIYSDDDYFRTSRLQIKGTGRGIRAQNTLIIKDSIVLGANIVGGAVIKLGGLVSRAINVVVVNLAAAGYAFEPVGFDDQLIACTMVRVTDHASTGTALNQYGNLTLFSCAIFGYSAISTGSPSGSSDSNATDLASGLPGSNNQHSVTYSQTTPFVDADKDSLDLRAVAATDLAANGYYDSTNAPNDISGIARANPPTIGAWELAATGNRRRRVICGVAA